MLVHRTRVVTSMQRCECTVIFHNRAETMVIHQMTTVAAQQVIGLQFICSERLSLRIFFVCSWTHQRPPRLQSRPNTREFQPEPELPFSVAPAVFPFVLAVFVDIFCTWFPHKETNSLPATCTETQPHAEMQPNCFTTRGHSRVHSVLIGTHKCHWGVVFLIVRV